MDSILKWERAKEDGLGTVHLSAHDLVVTAIPELGGKISSLQWNGREVLARNPRKPFRRAEYGAHYADYDASGFDECFPTIGACLHPDAPDMVAPDHGELWSLPWIEGKSDNELYLHVQGVHFPYSFHRWLKIAAMGHVRLRYKITSDADRPYRCLWSAHPLLALRPGMVIHLPEKVQVRVDWSRDGRLGDMLAEHPWPITTDKNENTVDLSKILPQDMQLVDKLYTTRLTEGWCALSDPADGYYVAMLFSPQQIPYIGLSINLGGWPLEGPAYYNLGLEPCNGYPDRLDVASQRGDCITLPPHSSFEWEWHLFVGQTEDLTTELKRLKGLM